jgi:uncharacterized protein YbjT (DUF2867 family)
MMRILVTGATGFIGSHIADAVTRAGYQLLVCVRNIPAAKRRFPGAEYIQADFNSDDELALWLSRLRRVDIVINTVGIIREDGKQTFDALHRDTPIALFRACEATHVKRVIQISALGADETAVSHYHLSKRSADTFLSSLGLDWAILMPSIVYGPNARSMALFKALSSLPLIPLVDSGEQRIQPLHIGDLVSAVIYCIESELPIRRRIELVGPEPVTMKSLLRQLRNWLGYGAARYVSIPYQTTLRLARWGGVLGCTPVDDEAVEMLKRGNTAKVSGFVDMFGYRPKSLTDALAELPAQQADRWHAGLYFIHPLLRWSIAFVWLFTGTVSMLAVPTELSHAMLYKAGVGSDWAPLFLYGASTIDLLLGLALIFRFHPKQTGLLQILLILLYTLIITISQPEHWLHPFGPVSKNAPMVVAILILMILEARQ